MKVVLLIVLLITALVAGIRSALAYGKTKAKNELGFALFEFAIVYIMGFLLFKELF